MSLSKKNIELISKQSIPEDENDNGLKENVCRGEKELENDEGVELRTRRHYQEVGQEAGGGWRFIFLSLKTCSMVLNCNCLHTNLGRVVAV